MGGAPLFVPNFAFFGIVVSRYFCVTAYRKNNV